MLKYVIKAEFLRLKVEVLNYYPDQIADFFIRYLLFFAFFKLTQSEKAVVMYIYWTIASTLISELSISMSQEKQVGTIDAIMMAPSPLPVILMVRSYLIFFFGLLKAAVLLLVIKMTLEFPPIALSGNMLLVFIISLIGFTGLGLLLAGLTLKYAKIASFEQLLMYGLLILSSLVPVLEQQSPWVQSLLKAFPYTFAIYRSQNSEAAVITAQSLVILLLGNCILLMTGLIVFQLFMRDAKRKGIANRY